MSPQKKRKRAQNEAYAERFRKKDKAQRKRERRARAELREQAWLEKTERGRGAWWVEGKTR